MSLYAKVDIDFDVFKAITALRDGPDVSENDVLRRVLGIQPAGSNPAEVWESEGVRFAVGTRLRHRFREGRIAEAEIVAKGIRFEGKVHRGFSPAAFAAGGTLTNGWLFWEVEQAPGKWVKATVLRG